MILTAANSAMTTTIPIVTVIAIMTVLLLDVFPLVSFSLVPPTTKPVKYMTYILKLVTEKFRYPHFFQSYVKVQFLQ